jgi:hypothetical protein
MGEFDVGSVAIRCRSRPRLWQNVRGCPSRRTDESHPARRLTHRFYRRGKQLTPLHAKPCRLWRPKINHQIDSHLEILLRRPGIPRRSNRSHIPMLARLTVHDARTARPDEDVTETPSIRNHIATMTRYRPAVSLLQRVQIARPGDPEVASGIVGSAATDHPIAAQPHSRLHPAVPTYESF